MKKPRETSKTRAVATKGLNAWHYARHLLIPPRPCRTTHSYLGVAKLLAEIFSSLALDENERGVATAEG